MCEETQKFFSSYLDGQLSASARDAVDVHLRECPVCRFQLNEMRAIVRDLGLVQRPIPPANLAASISNSLRIERAARIEQPSLALAERFFRWLEPRIMPYTVGAFASMILFISILGALRPQLAVLHSLAAISRESVEVVWVAPGEGYDITQPVSLEGYAAARTPYTVESPSLNPRGALAELAWTPSRSKRPDDDDMVVVADVYGNGSASLAEVLTPPRNPRMLDELQDALRKNPAFVPASLDHRPQTMRVVFVLQKMQVEERSF